MAARRTDGQERRGFLGGIRDRLLRLGTSRAGAQDTAGESASAAPESEPEPFDFEGFSRMLTSSGDPLGFLKLVVGSIRTREAAARGELEPPTAAMPAAGDGTDDAAATTPATDGIERVLTSPLTAPQANVPETVPMPSDFELFLARLLEEAGLFSPDVELPDVSVVRPHRTNLFYLRTNTPELPYLAMLRVIQIEAALNSLLFVNAYFDDLSDVTLPAAYHVLRRLRTSVTLLAPRADAQAGTWGEWATREAIATGIESFRLPYRLACDFRVSLALGNVSMQVELTPSEVFPASEYLADLGRVIPTTSSMRNRMAADYALRVVLLCAANAFAASPGIQRVFVAGTVSTATSHQCYLSVEFDRPTFQTLDLANLDDPAEAVSRFAGNVRLVDGILKPVRQTFSLEEERFCPAYRYELEGHPTRELPRDEATLLGARTLADLAINERAAREDAADAIVRRLGTSTQQNVRIVLDATSKSADPTVQDAAKRTLDGLIEGTLAVDDADAFHDFFVDGDELTRTVKRAFGMRDEQHLPEAINILTEALAPIDAAGTYQDTELVEWRCFRTYVDRVIYNRLYALEGHELRLVPQSYFDAHLALAIALTLANRPDDAVDHAQRLVELNPVETGASLTLATCLMRAGKHDEANRLLQRFLEVAHDPEGLGAGYFHLSHVLRELGKDEAAQACLMRSVLFASSASLPAMAELMGSLHESDGPGHATIQISSDDVEHALEEAGIVVAPTKRIIDVFSECMQASVDAEVFPVARNFVATMGLFTNDDVVHDILRSLEDCPDK